jgi:hypothetical protein
MSKDSFEQLEDKFEEIVNLMHDEFDSHEFILKLAQEHQRLYVQALVEYVKDDRPFQIVHGQIANRLLKFPSLVTKIGEHNSRDIFQQKNSATKWRKVRK